MSATLASLRIRNLALVEDLTWEPSAGFVAITGETGAGKSVLVGALTLLLGERGDKGLIRNGADACAIESIFENAADQRLTTLLDEFGAEPCEEGRLLIKRTLPLEGNGRQFVNGSPCTLALLRSLGELLVDLHGPHDHQSLFSREQQTRLLDRYAGSEETRNEFTASRRQILRMREEQQAILADEQAASREIDLLTHQVEEIDSATLVAGEEETLVARQRAAANFQRINELCLQLTSAVSESDDSLLSRLTDLSRQTRELSKLDPAAAKVMEECETLFASADDLSRTLASYAASREGESGNSEETETRLDLIQTLKRKYGDRIEEIIAFGEEASRRLTELQGRGERRDTLTADIASAETALKALGQKLSKLRNSAVKKLSEKVRLGLKDLGFAKAEFSITLETLAEASALGTELAEFLFAPNPGEPAHPLRSIASSGEISRVMLALKGALADQDDVPVLVFDEIDANVGGEIAAKVGQKMRELGETHQVLCITHLPQVAASARQQFIVSKEVAKGRTHTELAEVSGELREKELARMLGGQSDSALAHARALLTA